MRVPVVSRTIVTTVVNVVTLNVTTKKTDEVKLTFTREPKESAILAMAKDMLETDEVKVVYVKSKEVMTNKYVMPETDFVRLANCEKE